jgi:heme/copper-type cytochrome/quinol oxidase subunit 2
MKILILLLTLFSSVSYANSKCTWNDTSVEFVGSTWGLTPQTFYVQEGDRVCIKFSTADTNKSLFVQNTPLFLRATPRSSSEGQMIARKQGTYTVTCNGCSQKAQIIVQSKQEFQEYQRKIDRFNSLQNRNPHYLPEANIKK